MDSVTIGLNESKPIPPPIFTKPVQEEHELQAVEPGKTPVIPPYMQDIYYWAYLNPRNVRWLDHELIVRLILWEQHAKLRRAAFAEIKPGQQVLQSTCVYGKFLPMLAELIGPEGHLDLVDIAEGGCDKKMGKQAIRQLIDSGRCIYSYVGGSYVTLPPES